MINIKHPYVVAIGHVTADEYYQCLQNIRVGDKFFVRHIETLPGGMVANAACVLSALGTKTYLMSVLGSDKHTKMLLDSFVPCGVDTGYIDVIDRYSNFCTAILLEPGGTDRTIMLYENTEKPVAIIDEGKLELLSNAVFIYGLISNMKTLPNYRKLLTDLKKKGIRFMFDAECSTFTSKDEPEDKFFFELADIISFNSESVLQYCKGEGDEVVRTLIGGSDKIVIITRGSRGCTIVSSQEWFDCPCYVVDPVDTTGAGDTFNSAFLHSYLKGMELRECARFATAAANRSVLYYGARAGAVSENDVFEFIQEKEHVKLLSPNTTHSSKVFHFYKS